MNRERIQTEAYERYARYFEPDLFDPVDWARQAKRAGMTSARGLSAGRRALLV